MSEWDAYSLEELEQSKKDFSGLGMDTTIQAIDAAIANKEKGLQPVAGTNLYTKKKAPTSQTILDLYTKIYGSEKRLPKYIKDMYSKKSWGRKSTFRGGTPQEQQRMLEETIKNIDEDSGLLDFKKEEIKNYIRGMVDYSKGTGEQLASNFDWEKSLGDNNISTWKSETGFKVASAGDTWTDMGKIPLYGKAKDFENPFIPTGNYSEPKVKQPTMRDVAGPVVKQPIHKDTAQGQGQREEQMQRQQQQQQEREKYKDTATTGAKAGYTYGLQSGGKIKKVKSKYAKGGGVRASKYKL